MRLFVKCCICMFLFKLFINLLICFVFKNILLIIDIRRVIFIFIWFFFMNDVDVLVFVSGFCVNVNE